jgi:hypothetical protein
MELLKRGGTDKAPTNVTGVFAVGHVAGARDARRSTIIGLYRDGKVTPALAMQYGAKPGDHAEAMKHGVTLEALAAAGVEIKRVQNGQNRNEGKIAAAEAAKLAAIEAAKPKVAFMVRKAGGASKVVMTAQAKVVPTAQQAAVAVAVVMAAKAAAAKKDREAKGKKGFEAKLSVKEQEELIKRNAAKDGQAYIYAPDRAAK